MVIRKLQLDSKGFDESSWTAAGLSWARARALQLSKYWAVIITPDRLCHEPTRGTEQPMMKTADGEDGEVSSVQRALMPTTVSTVWTDRAGSRSHHMVVIVAFAPASCSPRSF